MQMQAYMHWYSCICMFVLSVAHMWLGLHASVCECRY